jgi:hypothetical protein
VAWMLHRAPTGRVSTINRLAPIILPFGFDLGRGKLRPIVICSALGWMIVASIAALFAATGFQPLPLPAGDHPQFMRSLMIAALVIDIFGLRFLIRQAAKYLSIKSPGLKPMIVVCSMLTAAVIGALCLWNLGWPTTATLLAGAPPLGLSIFYALLFLVSFKQRMN